MPKSKQKAVTTLVVREAKQQPKQKKKGRAGRSRAQPRGNVPGMVHAICSVTDPWCDAARGARMPEASTTPTISVPIRAMISNGSTSAGQLNAMAIMPGFPYGLGFATMSSAVASFGATSVKWDELNTWDGVVSEYRIVSAGVRITYTGAPLTASGRVILATGPSMPLGGTVNFTSPTYFNKWASASVASLISKPVTFFFSPDAEKARIYQTQNTNTTQTSDWDVLFIYADGLPASTQGIFLIEYIEHVEFRVGPSNSLAQIAAPPVPYNPKATALISTVQSKMPNFVRGTGEAAEAAVQSVVYQTIRAAGGMVATRGLQALGTYLGGPMGGAAGVGAAGMIMDVV